jgi:hypothetical protein
MNIRDSLREQITRLRVLWPVLNTRPEVTAEIEQAVMRYEPRLVDADIQRGFDTVIELSPTSGWPPGPSEIVGCVLQAASDRRHAQPRKTRNWGAGMTFAQWWHTMPADERGKHETLRRMMDPEGKLTHSAPEAGAIDWGQ